jgi:hypothetical protein
MDAVPLSAGCSWNFFFLFEFIPISQIYSRFLEIPSFSDVFRLLLTMGLIQVGVNVTVSRKTKPSASVHVAGRGQAAGRGRYPSRVLIVGFVLGIFNSNPFSIDLIKSVKQTNKPATQVWTIAFIAVNPPDLQCLTSNF